MRKMRMGHNRFSCAGLDHLEPVMWDATAGLDDFFTDLLPIDHEWPDEVHPFVESERSVAPCTCGLCEVAVRNAYHVAQTQDS